MTTRLCTRRAAIAAFVAAFALPATAAAGELEDLLDALAAFLVRVDDAREQVRSGGRDAAALDVARMRDAWGVIASRFGKRPEALSGNAQEYNTAMLDISTRLVGVSIMIESGRQDGAQNAFSGVREAVTALMRLVGEPRR